MNAYSVPGSVLSIEDAKIDLFIFGGVSSKQAC